ncbi:SCAMP1 [Acrasis kona]|uniref:SCAMP1 n=1 Tax=Acrasis kona TaxID=1008807 RepID=A0AAW2YLW9_9EUKA
MAGKYGTNSYGSSANANSDPYDYDYQPFGAKGAAKLNEPFPSNNEYDSFSSAPFGDDEDMRLKQMELQRREEELIRREQEIQIKEGVISDTKKNNWPICKPFLYHNISQEVQPGIKRVTTYSGYSLWIAVCLAYILNFGIAITTVILPVDKDNGIKGNVALVQHVLCAGLLMFAIPPLHFIICYWPLYKAMTTLTIGRFVLFFLGNGFAILYTLFAFAGALTGVSGLYTVIIYFPHGDPQQGNPITFGLNLMVSFIWFVFILIFIAIFIICIVVARRENMTFSKAVQYTKGAVVSTAGSFATQAVVSGATGGSQV